MNQKIKPLLIILCAVVACVFFAMRKAEPRHAQVMKSPRPILPGTSYGIRIPAPLSGWGPGHVVAHGSVSCTGQAASDWPAASNSVRGTGSGFGVIPGHLRSAGYWEIIFPWQGKGSPPPGRYVTRAALGVRVTRTKNTEEHKEVIEPNVLAPAPVFYGGGFADSSVTSMSMCLDGTVKHTRSSYYLYVRTWPVNGEVRQTSILQKWGGEVIAEVKFTPPFYPEDPLDSPRPQFGGSDSTDLAVFKKKDSIFSEHMLSFFMAEKPLAIECSCPRSALARRSRRCELDALQDHF